MSDDGITVLVVDDQPIYHEMVRRILAGHPDISVVAVATTVTDAIEQARIHQPDVVLMDQQLPDGRGTEAARRIHGVLRRVRVVMVTATTDDRTLVEARKAGCSGYVLKDRLIHDLAAAVRTAHRGESTLPDRGVDLFLSSLVDDDVVG